MIRLQRIGKNKKPSYRLVISEKARDTQGNALEILGHYNPVGSDKTLELKEDRIKYWLSVGAQASETVNNLLVKAGVITTEKKKSVAISNKRKVKMEKKKGEVEEKKKATEEKAKAAAEAAKAAEVEIKAEEAPVEVVEEPKAEETPVVEESKVEESPSADAQDKKEEVSAEEPKEEAKEEEKVEEKTAE